MDVTFVRRVFTTPKTSTARVYNLWMKDIHPRWESLDKLLSIWVSGLPGNDVGTSRQVTCPMSAIVWRVLPILTLGHTRCLAEIGDPEPGSHLVRQSAFAEVTLLASWPSLLHGDVAKTRVR